MKRTKPKDIIVVADGVRGFWPEALSLVVGRRDVVFVLGPKGKLIEQPKPPRIRGGFNW